MESGCPHMFPRVLPMRERSETIDRTLAGRLDTVLPVAMREAGLDMWIIICQEDDLDPVFTTMIPMDCWCPILQILVFYDTGDGIERINLGRTNTKGLYDRPLNTEVESVQWAELKDIVAQRDPQRIGINIGAVQWAAGGLTHNLYLQLRENLPEGCAERLVSAEHACTRWLATLTDEEVPVYEHVVSVAHAILAECLSPETIVPGITTTTDVEWAYWQRAADLGLDVSFRPFFGVIRSTESRERHGKDDRTIRPGDYMHSDVGIKYMRYNSDHQHKAYILRPGETDAPDELKRLMGKANRLQDVFMGEFQQGLTGNELLSNILTRARTEGIPSPKVYSHSLGYFLHEPGPLIGLPWEQERCVGRGDVKLEHNYCFTMELSVCARVEEWNDEEFRLSLEEDVIFEEAGCRVLDGRRTTFHLI